MPVNEETRTKEFNFLAEFARKSLSVDEESCSGIQLRALWTAYCIHQDFEVDTAAYDENLLRLWNAVKERSSFTGWKTFDQFDNYMCLNLV